MVNFFKAQLHDSEKLEVEVEDERYENIASCDMVFFFFLINTLMEMKNYIFLEFFFFFIEKNFPKKFNFLNGLILINFNYLNIKNTCVSVD